MIESNFEDFYDKFISPDVKFRRLGSDLPKDNGLILLKSLGFTVPAHGQSKQMFEALVRDMFNGNIEEAKSSPTYDGYDVVVIPDVLVHDQSKLEVMHIEKAVEKYPSGYVTQLHSQKKAMTYTVTKVGRKLFWHESVSDDAFRSGVGNVKTRSFDPKSFTRMQGINEGVLESFKVPLMSIDFVVGGGRGSELIAVDLNLAPKLAGTVIEEDSDPEEFADHINRYLLG